MTHHRHTSPLPAAGDARAPAPCPTAALGRQSATQPAGVRQVLHLLACVAQVGERAHLHAVLHLAAACGEAVACASGRVGGVTVQDMDGDVQTHGAFIVRQLEEVLTLAEGAVAELWLARVLSIHSINPFLTQSRLAFGHR